MSSMSCLLGMTPASVSASALRMTMNSMAIFSLVADRLLRGVAPLLLATEVIVAHGIGGKVGHLRHLPYFELGARRHRRFAHPGDRLVAVLGLDDPEAADQLLGFGE